MRIEDIEDKVWNAFYNLQLIGIIWQRPKELYKNVNTIL